MGGDESLDTWVEHTEEHPTSTGPRYEVVSQIGRGAMGVVEAVRDHRLQRVVARKRLVSAGQRAGFQREAQVAAALEHPGIVPIYEASEGEEGPWYTMRRIEGASLQEALEQTSSLDGRLALLGRFERLCEAVAYVHGQGVVHRDLKPANVMLGPYGEVVLVDFGLAVRAGDEGAHRGGTPAYMAPEAVQGAAPAPTADVWSLGAVLYELLAGRRWLKGKAQTVLRTLEQGPLPPLDGLDDAPPELVAVVHKALRPEVARRYPDAEALRRDVSAFSTGRLVGAHAYTTRELLTRFVWRTRGYLAMAGVAGALVVGVTVVAAGRLAAERDRAVAAEEARTQQLALALEARARALGSDPEAIEVARQSLRLDPRLPWARGILAEFASHARAEPRPGIAAKGCTEIELLAADRLVAGCDDGLRLIDTDTGQVLDTHAETLRTGFERGDGWLGVPAQRSFLVVRVADDRLAVQGVSSVPWGTGWSTLKASGPDDEVLVLHSVDEGSMQVHELVEGELVARSVLATGFLARKAVRGARGQLLWGHDGVLSCDVALTRCEALAVPGIVQHALWSSDGGRALLLTTTGEAYMYDLASGQTRLMDRGRAGGVLDVGRLDGDRVAVLDASGRVELYDDGGSLLDEIDATEVGARDLAVWGDEVWVVGRRGMARWRVGAEREPASRRFPNGVGVAAAVDDQLFVSHDDVVYRVDGAHIRPVAKLGHFVKDLMGHDGQLYVSTIFGLTRLDPDRGTFEVEVPRGARRAGVAGDRRWVLANDGSVLDQSGEPTPWHSVGDLAAADRFLAVAPTNDSLAVIDVDSAQTAWSGQVAGEPWALALSPDGSELAYALDDHRVRLVDLSTGTTTLLDGVHRSFVADLQFSPSGRRLASVSWDGTSRIWREGRLEAALEAHGGRATTAAFLTDDMLYTGSWDQTLRRWDLSAWGDPLIP